ncbi:MAG: LamG-like jellyroll fold domain-containing protein [Candidatus Paceibacterota bacterium]
MAKNILDNKKSGFTLIEIMVAILILGVISGIVIVNNLAAVNTAVDTKVKTFATGIPVSLSGNYVAFWNFDKCSGSSVTADCITDSWGANGYISSTENPIVINGTAPTVASGSSCVNDKCLVFSGSNAITIKEIGLGKKVTISFWMKVSNYTNIMPFSLETLNAYDVGLLFEGGTNSMFWSPEVDDYNIFTGSAWPNENWHHYVVINNDVTNVAKLYVDGIKSGEAEGLDTTTSPATTDARFMIGGSYAYFPTYFAITGSMDEVQIFDDALSIAQIDDIYIVGLNNLLKNNGITKAEYDSRLASLNKNIALLK